MLSIQVKEHLYKNQGCRVGVARRPERRFWLESESEFKTAMESEKMPDSYSKKITKI